MILNNRAFGLHKDCCFNSYNFALFKKINRNGLCARSKICIEKRINCKNVDNEEKTQMNDKNKSDKQIKNEENEKFVEQLKKQGITSEAANRILKIWKDAGYESTEDLRKIFIRGSLRPLLVSAGQLFFDAGATVTSFVIADIASRMPQDIWTTISRVGGTFFGIYSGICCVFDILTLSVIILSIFRLGTNAEGFITAMKQIASAEGAAGAGGGVGVIKKIKQSADAFKIIKTLNEISDVLKNMEGKQMTTVENLAAYLTLSRAEDKFGFSPEKYKLTQEEAMDIAVVFSRYDQNDDGVLQTSELKNLCSSLGTALNDEEVEAAMKILDTDNSGFIEFEEFVSWWVDKVKLERAEKLNA